MIRIEPRPEQTTALAALHRAFALHDRTQLVMACGTGKTFVSRWHAQAIDAETTVVFAPSLALVAQILGEWRRVDGWMFEALVVCSDPTTAAGAAERHRHDDGVHVDRPYWAKVAADVTTDPARAARFLVNKTPGRAQVVFSTYHSAPVVAAAQAAAGPQAEFDLMVCDEAHQLAGRPRPEFRTVLDQKALAAGKRLFMTATPQVLEGEDVVSMDDESTFGPRAHTVTFGEAINAGRLCDYQVLVIAARPGQRSGLPSGAEAVPAVLLDAIDRHGLRRLLSFHGRVDKARSLAGLLDLAHTPGGRWVGARHVNGTQPTAERSQTLAWLGEDQDTQVRLVTNARCLSEGVDVPAVDGIVFADEPGSVVKTIQAIGRGLRPAPGKTKATIIIPITLADDGDDDTSLSTSKYSLLWTVLRSLRCLDERFSEGIDELGHPARKAGPSRAGPAVGDRVEFVLPSGVDVEPLRLRLVQEVGSAWEKFFQAALAWTAANPGKRLPRIANYQGVGVGEWAAKQRMARARGTLADPRAARLETIPGWYWVLDDAEWADTYQLLVEHAAVHGTAADNAGGASRFDGLRSKGSPRRRMGVWAALQRQLYRDDMLPDDRVRRLEELPGWDWNNGLTDQHVAMIQALRLFGEFEKHTDVPESHLENDLPLGRWVWSVRRSKLLGQLPPALVDEIAAAVPRGHKGAEVWSWEHAETQWRLLYSALRQYAAREGHPVPPGTHEEQFAGTQVGLGQWVARQRHLHRRGNLEARFVGYLQALPGWLWDVPLTEVDYGQPLDLGGHPHGTAKGIAAGCPCRECLDTRRARDRQRLAKQRQECVTDPVDAGPARHHLAALELRGVKRMAVVAKSGVSLGAIRKIVSGEWVQIDRSHEAAILALTAQDCLTVATRAGSRGRTATRDAEMIDAAPTWRILDDLDSRGLGMLWVSRELGYVGGLQIRRDHVSRRIAEQVESLAQRAQGLSWPRRGNERIPCLAQLQAEAGAGAGPRPSTMVLAAA